jgi:Formaldehyde-activating enzyme (Fae)
MFGPAQHAVAKAVADSVAEGVIPANEADDLFITVGVFIHWEAKDDKKIQDFNYRATKEAIARAVKAESGPDQPVCRVDPDLGVGLVPQPFTNSLVAHSDYFDRPQNVHFQGALRLVPRLNRHKIFPKRLFQKEPSFERRGWR